MRFIKKDNLFVFAILLTVVSTVVILFYPGLIDYSHSYKDLKEKREDIESTNLELNKKKIEIVKKTDSLRELKEVDEERHSAAVEVKRNIREEDFELDMPSFLISMEQQARKSSVHLNIDYNSIRTVDNSENSIESVQNMLNSTIGNEDTDVEANSEETDEVESSKVESLETEDNVTDEQNDDEMLFSEEEITRGIVEIDGVNVTVIPISIEGSYSSVRSYIKYLDEIGMIEPSSVNLESEERIVKGKIILNVFHGEVL